MRKMSYFFLFIFLAGTAFAQNLEVEFRVDMSVKAQEGLFNPETDVVKIAGTFNNWTNGVDTLTDLDNDSIYTITIDTFAVNDTLYFKFIRGAEGWENNPDRQYVVPEGNSVFFDYFDRDSVVSNSVELTFSCNMEFEIVSGRFDTGRPDTLSARGSMNGWSGTDYMFPSISDPNYYEKTITYAASLNDIINYKFAYATETGLSWEQNPSPTQDNYQYTITQEDISNGFAFIERTFNNLTLDNVTNNPITLKFVVNMDSAINVITNQPFAEIENVFIAGANAPLQWPNGGWPNTDTAAIHFLYNDGTHGDATADDSLWSIDLTFPQYSSLRIIYKYGANWAGNNGGSNDNEAPSGNDHTVNFTPDMLSGTVRNQFGVTGEHELEDVITTGVEEISDIVPAVYSLSQNYPNPFNPTTNIQFSVPQAGMVTLKVYNLLGQEVATLLNEHKNAGSYKVDFNAASLSSGVYFYSIKAENYSSTKKMTLIK